MKNREDETHNYGHKRDFFLSCWLFININSQPRTDLNEGKINDQNHNQWKVKVNNTENKYIPMFVVFKRDTSVGHKERVDRVVAILIYNWISFRSCFIQKPSFLLVSLKPTSVWLTNALLSDANYKVTTTKINQVTASDVKISSVRDKREYQER